MASNPHGSFRRRRDQFIDSFLWHSEKTLKRAAWGAIAGALIGGFYLVDLGDLVFSGPEGARWNEIATIIAVTVAGAFIGALTILSDRHPFLLVPAIPIAGAIAGAVFWQLRKPEGELVLFVVIGVLTSLAFAFLGWLESRR